MTALIEIENVTRFYGKGEAEVHALDGVSLRIESGEFVAIVGQSGSGKSTLMNILGCLDRPTSGTYCVGGRDVSRLSPDDLAALRRNTFGFVFQRYNLLSNASAAENVEMPAIYAGDGIEERRIRAQQLLEKLGLGDRGHHRPTQLSGGQQQRVAIARALMNDAEVILADEPTGALDSQSGAELLSLLEELHASGRTIILITHDNNVAAHAHRIIEIADGKIISDTGAKDRSTTAARYEKHTFAPSPLLQAKEAVKTAFRSLRANLFRTSLTLLGIVIGVSAVVAMLAIGEGSSKQVVANIENMGSNLLQVFPGAPGMRMRGSAIATLTMDDAERLAELENVIVAVPTRESRATLRFNETDYQTSIQGITAEWPRARNWTMAYGSFFTAEDQTRRAAVTVLGYTVAGNLFNDPANAVGQYVFIGSAPFEVAGVLAPKGTTFGRDQDDIALVPITTGMMRLFGQDFLSNITIAVEDTRRISETEAAAQALLLRRHGTEDFQIGNAASFLEMVQDTQKAFSALLGSIAAISLIVGGIGVMNIMLVSVTERTREIGVRMATGARRSDIMMQFNTEALVVGALGGVIGVLIGLGVSLILGATGMSIAITPGPAIIAFSSALAIGLIFGFMPARKAARLDPVIALASE